MAIRGALLMCFAGAFIALAQELPYLSIDEAVSLALQGNRDIRSAKIDIARSENDVMSARTYRLPSFDLHVFEGQFLRPVQFIVPTGAWGNYSATGPIPAAPSPITTPAHPFTLLEARAVEPLSRWHSITLGIRIRQILSDEASEKLSTTRIELTSQVRRLYYEILESQSAIKA